MFFIFNFQLSTPAFAGFPILDTASPHFGQSLTTETSRSRGTNPRVSKAQRNPFRHFRQPSRHFGHPLRGIRVRLNTTVQSRAVLPKPPHEPVSAKLAYLKLRPLPPLRDFGHLSTSFWTALCRTIKTSSRTKTRRHKEIYSIHFGQPLRVVGDWLSRDIVRFPDSVSALTIPFFPFFPLLSFRIPLSRASCIFDFLDSPVQNH